MRPRINVGLIIPNQKKFQLKKNFHPTDQNVGDLVGFDPKFEDVLKFEDGTFISILRDEDDALFDLEGPIENRTEIHTKLSDEGKVTMLTKT